MPDYTKPAEEEEQDGQQIEKINETVDKGIELVSEFRAGIRDAMEAKEMDGGQSSDNDTDGDNMTDEIDAQDITQAIDKFIALKGDMKLSEAKEFINNNEDMVSKFL